MELTELDLRPVIKLDTNMHVTPVSKSKEAHKARKGGSRGGRSVSVTP